MTDNYFADCGCATMTENGTCFNYSEQECKELYSCSASHIHDGHRYNDVSATWVLTAAIIVFFMRAGFMLIELAFAQEAKERRHVVVLKLLDVFASAFGFFLIGYEVVSDYHFYENYSFYQLRSPLLWFFKFTFASNAATIVGGCLVTSDYKLRLPAAFVSAFVISGIIHPLIARFIWSDNASSSWSLSPYRFCNYSTNHSLQEHCPSSDQHGFKLYTLDFAGGGAVHMLAGVAGLVLCLFAKLQKYIDTRRWRNNPTAEERMTSPPPTRRDYQDLLKPRNFWEWMYPRSGGSEHTGEAALGVFILWFSWFAFNCGSSESMESPDPLHVAPVPYYAIPAKIAVNMIMAGASGGIAAVCIGTWAQHRTRSESVNAKEIANGVLSSLVAITAGCPFVEYWAACLIGLLSVVFYHIGCYLEYKLGIEDTAKVIPVHGVCGLWGLLAVGLFMIGGTTECILHGTFEGLCYCRLRLPVLSFGEHMLSQLAGAVLMIAITTLFCVVVYGAMFLIPLELPCARVQTACCNWVSMACCLNRHSLDFKGNLLFTKPQETLSPYNYNVDLHPIVPRTQPQAQRRQQDYGSIGVPESLGSIPHLIERTAKEEEEEEVTPTSTTGV